METSRLLEAWYGGNDRALDELLDRHLPTIRAMVRKRMGRSLRAREESGDLVQDALIRFLRSRPMVRIENTKVLNAFLVRVIENVLKDKFDFYSAQRRSSDREERFPSQGILHLETPSVISSREEQREWVRLGVEFLSEKDREVVILKEWKQETFVQIGEKTGEEPDTVRKRHRKAMMRFSEVLLRLQEGQVGEMLTESGHLDGAQDER